MVHSFGSSGPPFTTHSTAFESTLKRELGTAVDLDEVSRLEEQLVPEFRHELARRAVHAGLVGVIVRR